MATTPKPLKLKPKRQKSYKNKTWSEFIFLFNKKHNSNLKVNTGIVNVKTKNNVK